MRPIAPHKSMVALRRSAPDLVVSSKLAEALDLAHEGGDAGQSRRTAMPEPGGEHEEGQHDGDRPSGAGGVSFLRAHATTADMS